MIDANGYVVKGKRGQRLTDEERILRAEKALADAKAKAARTKAENDPRCKALVGMIETMSKANRDLSRFVDGYFNEKQSRWIVPTGAQKVAILREKLARAEFMLAQASTLPAVISERIDNANKLVDRILSGEHVDYSAESILPEFLRAGFTGENPIDPESTALADMAEETATV